MRGQKLYIRPITPSDRDAIEQFLTRHGRPGASSPESGLLGKLVGDLVAVLPIRISGDDIHIDDLVVAPELRRKQIGRYMLGELERMAAGIQRSWLVVDEVPADATFLRRVGFVQDGGRMLRRVGND
jgi:GNAT superfamily N-acetyltransferase